MSGDHGDGLPEEHEEHGNHEAWVIPYADLLTLLMAMFIALFAMSTVDQAKATAVQNGFKEAIGGKVDSSVFAGTKGNTIVPGQNAGTLNGANNPTANGGEASSAINAALAHAQAVQQAKASEQKALANVEQTIKDAAKKLGVSSDITFQLEGRGLVVRVVSDQVLFDSGSAVLLPEGQRVLRLVGTALGKIDNPLVIEGHTDSTPIDTAQYPSNWELSGARAGAVVRFFTDIVGLDANRMRPEEFADRKPIATNATPEGRAKNRRVEIVVQSKAIDQLLSGYDLSDKTTGSSGSNAPDLSKIVGSLASGG